MSSDLAPRFGGLVSKWLGSTFLLFLSFIYIAFLKLVIQSNLILLSFLFSLSVSFLRTTKELSSVTDKCNNVDVDLPSWGEWSNKEGNS